MLRWSTFWQKVGGVSIRTKIMGIVALCIVCATLAMVWFAYRDVSGALRNELVERGITIGTGLAAQSRDLLVTNNQFLLHTLVREQHAADPDLVYVFVLDGSGNVMAHTFGEGFPADLLGVNQVKPEESYRVQALQTENDWIQDVAVPVFGGKAGVVRLGMSEVTIRAAVTEYIRNILLWVALIMVLGLYVAYGLASILAKPISRLSEAARAIGKGDFKWKAPIWARDEIGNLGTAFNEMSDELKHKEEMREQLLAKVISAQEDERKRIARELHDETSQALTSLMVGLKFAEDSTDTVQIRGKTTELRALAAQILENVHDLATELRPSLLDDLGLVAAIQRYAREYSTKMNINVDSHVSGLNEQRLPPEVDIAVYRIIQEALTNIAKHAEASNVSVILRYHDSSLVAIVEDDGGGFNVDSVMASPDEERLGLFGMYERVSLVGGKITIESQPGVGTTIYLDIPLKLIEET
jgi:signal transduction histidine kinase